MSLKNKLEENAIISLDIIGRYLKGEKINPDILAMAKLSVQFANIKIKTSISSKPRLEDGPVEFFKRVLINLIEDDVARFDHIDGFAPSIGSGECIGFFDDHYLYIISNKIMPIMKKTKGFDCSTHVFYKILRETGIISGNNISTNKSRFTIKRHNTICHTLRVKSEEFYNEIIGSKITKTMEGK